MEQYSQEHRQELCGHVRGVMRTWKKIAAAAAVVCSLCFGSATAHAELFGGFASPAINAVRKGVLPEYSKSISVGGALDHYKSCVKGTTSWSEFETEKGEHLVEFSCRLRPEDRDILKNDNQALFVMLYLSGVMAALSDDEAAKQEGFAQNLVKQSVSFKNLNFSVQFAMSLLNENEFELSYIGLDTEYEDGLTGNIPLFYSALHAPFADVDVFTAMDESITEEERTEVLTTALQARIEAAANNLRVAAYGNPASQR